MNVRQLAARVDPAQVAPQTPPTPAAPDRTGRSSFADELRRLRETRTTSTDAFTVSVHAQERMRQRGISLTDGQQQSMQEAFGLLEAKGAREAVLLREDAAFVVSVPNRTVVTALHRDEMQQRVFTQIDSAMLV